MSARMVMALGDTHGSHEEVGAFVERADILVFSGDACNYGSMKEMAGFARWWRALKPRHKVFVAGNHDWPCVRDLKSVREWLGPETTYLENSGATIDGLTFWGTPWTPPFHDWAFNANEARLVTLFAQCPVGVDFLITHGPARGVMDRNRLGVACGSTALATALERIQPKAHVFGHIHEGYGTATIDGVFRANVSVMDGDYRARNLPIQMFVNGRDEAVQPRTAPDR